MEPLIEPALVSSQNKNRTSRPTLILEPIKSIIFKIILSRGYKILKHIETQQNNTYIITVVNAKNELYVIKCSKKYNILQEINIIKSLENNYIVNTFNEKGIVFIIMNYLGEDLFSVIPKLNIDKKNLITTELIRQLKDLHINGIIHLDLKPENIMILMNEKEEILKITIIDYEYSRLIHSDSLECPVYVGTLGYISPEVYKKTRVNTYTDIWSLGITIYGMYTGNTLFADKFENNIKIKTLECNFDYFEENLKQIPPNIVILIRNMLKVNPYERYF